MEARNKGDMAYAKVVLGQMVEMMAPPGRRALTHKADVQRMMQEPAPELRYLFSPSVPLGVLGGINAGGGTGKGNLIQILAVPLLTGKRLIPYFCPARIRRVLWVEAEDPEEEVHRRFDRIFSAYGPEGLFGVAEHQLSDEQRSQCLVLADRELVAQGLVLYAENSFPVTEKTAPITWPLLPASHGSGTG